MVRVWDVGQKRQLRTFRTERNSEGVTRSATFAPDGRSLGLLTDQRILQFDVDSGKPVAGFTSPMANLAAVRFTPDGKQFVGVGADGRVHRWEARTGKAVSETKKALFDEGAVGLADCDAAAAVAAVVIETSIHLIDLRTGKLLHEPAAARTILTAVRFASKTEVVCLGEDGSLRSWDPSNGKPIKVERLLPADEPEPGLTDLSPDGRRLAVVDDAGTLRVLQGKKELWNTKSTDKDVPSQLRFSHDGASLAVVREGGIAILDAATGKRRAALVIGGDGDFEIQWSRDGRMLAVANTGLDEVSVWEVATGRKRQTLELKGPLGMAFAPDGRRLAVAGANGVLHVFELGGEAAVLELAVGEPEVQVVAFSPDGSRLAAAVGDTVRLWHADGRPLSVFRGHEAEIHDIAFAPDGRTLVSVSQDGTALVWDAVNPLRAVRPRKADKTTAALWQDLGDDDAMSAFRAIAGLRETPAETVAFLKGRLIPAKAVDPKEVERLLANLESDDFATREKAVKDLEALDVQVEGALRAALAKRPGADARMWLKMLIEKLEGPPSHPERLRELRAIEVLEQLATADARALLEALAAGAESRLTREAKAALRRLKGE
jgi:WD40 repeat protein